MDDWFKQLYEYLEELETDLWRRGELALELGLQDPEGYWYRRYREAVMNGATQKDRDRLYKKIIGSRESGFWNTLECAMCGDDQLQRITQITREQDR
jgi:hypothetical protein